MRAKVLFCGIGNIHTMRASLDMLHKCLVPWLPSKRMTAGVNGPGAKLIGGGINMISMVKAAFTSSKTDSSAISGGGGGGGSGGGVSGGGDGATENGCDEAGQLGGEGQDSANSVSPPSDSRYLLQRVEETHWLEHIRVVMASSALVAEKLYSEGCGVLVHCSDGWDRTAQVSEKRIEGTSKEGFCRPV